MNAIEFLEWFRPGGPWVLTAIVPDKGTSTTTFRADQKDRLQKWLEAKDGYENIYFQVNGTGDRNITKKTSKGDIISGDWLHVDIDPNGDAELFDADRARILKRLQAFAPKPSLIIDSGGGFQGFWRLSEPVHAEDWADFERYNKQLEIDLGGDHCHNVDRIMRLPGTTNVPTKKKLKKGRKPAPTKVVHHEDKTFALDVFRQAALVDGGDRGDVGRPSVQLSGNLPRLDSVDDLDEWNVSQHVKMLIVQGMDPDNPDRYPSRSECFWFVVCELVRSEVPDDVIGSVILDEGFLISGHVLDQKNPEGYAVRQIQRAKEHAINPLLTNMNDENFVTFVGGKVRVVTEKLTKERGRELIFKPPGDFQSFLSNQLVEIGRDPKTGMPLTMKMGKWWYEHPQRRSYEGLVFDPSGEAPADHYNLWRGFAYAAKEGKNHERFLDHLFENICNGNQEHYDYLIRWTARIIQTPATQSETAIVMRGREGTGKNTFVKTVGSLFPEHYFESSSSQQFLGNFNSHLRDKVLVHANEAFFAGDKKHEATLKMLITEATMPIEAKGVDISMEPNYTHIVMSSNSEWVVPAGPDSRRFLVLDVSDRQMQKSGYFAKLWGDLNAGGRSHLLRFLLDFDLSGWNVRDVPRTAALQDQKIRTMPKEVQWLMTVLDQGWVTDERAAWAEPVAKHHAHNSYIKMMQDIGEQRRMNRVAFSLFLKKNVPGIKIVDTIVDGHRGGFIFPALDECRAFFDREHGGPFEWQELQAFTQGDIPF